MEHEALEPEQEKISEAQSKGPSTANVVGKSVLKVLTSATFIRGAFGVLSKIFKK